MGFSFRFFTSPFPWLFLSAIFFGAALSRASRTPFGTARLPLGGRSQICDSERAKTIKWIFFSLYLSLCLVGFLCALFIPGLKKMSNILHLYFFLGSSVFFFLAFRFKKSIGALALFLIIALLVVVLLFIQSLTAFTGETEIAQIRVIDIQVGDKEEMKLELIPSKPGRETAIIEMAGTYFAPVVSVVIFDDCLVFMGVKTWYRFRGITSFKLEKKNGETVFRQQETDFYFPHALGISERLWSFYERHERNIPGVRSVQIEMDLKRARELSSYSVRVQNDGGIQIIEVD